eukprot:4781045-Alexandrium_andersonii.AAC.1
MATFPTCLDGRPAAQLRAWDARIHAAADAMEEAAASAAPRAVTKAAADLVCALEAAPLPREGALSVTDIVRCHGLRRAESAVAFASTSVQL